MGGRMMDSPYSGRVQDSPFLRAQEAKYGSGFSLGPGMHEAGASEGGGAGGGAVDTPQSTADLTAFVSSSRVSNSLFLNPTLGCNFVP